MEIEKNKGRVQKRKLQEKKVRESVKRTVFRMRNGRALNSEFFGSSSQDFSGILKIISCYYFSTLYMFIHR